MTNNLMAATSALPQVLVSGFVPTTLTKQYEALSNTSVKIANAVLTNISGAAVAVSVCLVKGGGVAGSSNRILSAYSISPGDSLVLSELAGHVLGPLDFISAIAGASGAEVSFVVSGTVFS